MAQRAERRGCGPRSRGQGQPGLVPTGLLPMDGGGRGQVWSGAGVEPLGRPRGSNGRTGGERGRVQFYPAGEGPREQHGPAGGRKAWGVRGREKERERGGQANTHVHRVIPNEN